ncbi:hypothetical protein [Alienimonas sp. DA493]|uniref:hypothetical protein n=1 Tax=Alienimonas sp. DA493 TaxID=3373605 RepID=UPI003754CACC
MSSEPPAADEPLPRVVEPWYARRWVWRYGAPAAIVAANFAAAVAVSRFFPRSFDVVQRLYQAAGGGRTGVAAVAAALAAPAAVPVAVLELRRWGVTRRGVGRALAATLAAFGALTALVFAAITAVRVWNGMPW